MSTQIQEKFIQSVKGIETRLTQMGFSHKSTTRKGYATYIEFEADDTTQILFMFGPSDWHVEILLTTGERKYAFKDLLQIPPIAQWTRDNKFQERTRDRVNDEVAWFVDLLIFVFRIKPWTNYEDFRNPTAGNNV